MPDGSLLAPTTSSSGVCGRGVYSYLILTPTDVSEQWVAAQVHLPSDLGRTQREGTVRKDVKP